MAHEYAHVLLNRTLSAQPLWLAEGLAEVFARWTPSGAGALVGRPAPDHLRRLQRERPLPLSQLLRLDDTSPLYNEGDQRGVFYAHSWALAHWALFGRGPSGPADLRSFLASVAGGVDPERAFGSAFGADVATAERLLAAYVAGPLPVPRFEVAGLDAGLAVESEAPGAAEVEYRLGELLLYGTRIPEARHRLERAIAIDPGFAPAHAALGQAAVRQGRWDEAHREMSLALATDPSDSIALYRFLSDHLLSKVDRVTAGTVEATGTLLALECRADGILRFVVEQAPARLRLDARSATSVFLYGRDGSPIERDFTCGMQREPVRAALPARFVPRLRRDSPLAHVRIAPGLALRPGGTCLALLQRMPRDGCGRAFGGGKTR